MSSAPRHSHHSPSAAPTPSEPAEELSRVVLRGAGGAAGPRLRHLVVALVVLLCVEVLLRLLLPPDERLVRDPLHPYGCFQDDALARLLGDRARVRRAGPSRPGLDIVLLGDSVLSSVNNRPGERLDDVLPAALAPRLPTADLRVYSLGEGGAHAADLYAAYLRLQAALAAEPTAPGGPARPLIVVLNSNIIFFSRRHANPPMLFPCLADGLPPESADVRALLRLPPPPDAIEAGLTRLATRHVYLLQQRRRLGELLFGGPPRDRLRDLLIHALRRGPEATGDPNLPWTARGLSAAQYAASYDLIPLDAAEATNLQLTRRLSQILAAPRPGQAVFVFLTPHNHGLLGALADNPAYHAASAAIGAVFRERGVPFRSYDGQVDAGLFMDLDHLTADGNRRLAQLLAADLESPARRLLTGSP